MKFVIRWLHEDAIHMPNMWDWFLSVTLGGLFLAVHFDWLAWYWAILISIGPALIAVQVSDAIAARKIALRKAEWALLAEAERAEIEATATSDQGSAAAEVEQ